MTTASAGRARARPGLWALAVMMLPLLWATPGAAATKGEELVERSRLSIERLLTDPALSEMPKYIREAAGILIVPQLVKGGFIVGGEGGSGVFMVRGSDGSWSNPSFYTLAGGSIGLQLGGQVSEVVLTVMNADAVRALLSDQVMLGADISVALGPFGKGLEASTTTNLDADVYAFSRTVGLFGGGGLKGAALFHRGEWNDDYYDASTTPYGVLIQRSFYNTHAEALRSALP